MATVKELWGKTAGYKTVGSGIVLLAWEFFTSVFPHVMSTNVEQWGTKFISFGIGIGLFDKMWRDKQKVSVFFNTIISKFKKKK